MDKDSLILGFVMSDVEIPDDKIDECILYVKNKTKSIEDISDDIIKEYISKYKKTLSNNNIKKEDVTQNKYQYEDEMLARMKQNKEKSYGIMMDALNSFQDFSYGNRQVNDKEVIDYISKKLVDSGYHFSSGYINDISKIIYFSYLSKQKNEDIINGKYDLTIMDIAFKMSDEYKNISNAIYSYLGKEKSLFINNNRRYLETMIAMLVELAINGKDMDSEDRFDKYICSKLAEEYENIYHQKIQECFSLYDKREYGTLNYDDLTNTVNNQKRSVNDVDWKKIGKGAALLSAGLVLDMAIPIGYFVYKVVKNYKENNSNEHDDYYEETQGKRR